MGRHWQPGDSYLPLAGSYQTQRIAVHQEPTLLTFRQGSTTALQVSTMGYFYRAVCLKE
jgi:hypothetical protein